MNHEISNFSGFGHPAARSVHPSQIQCLQNDVLALGKTRPPVLQVGSKKFCRESDFIRFLEAGGKAQPEEHVQ